MSRHILFCLGLILAIPTAQAADSAKADLRTADGKTIGSATLADTPKGVLITLVLKGAPCGPSATKPCFLWSGLKWAPADLKGDSHLPTSWTWKA